MTMGLGGFASKFIARQQKNDAHGTNTSGGGARSRVRRGTYMRHMKENDIRRRIDRNEKVRIYRAAEIMEKRVKAAQDEEERLAAERDGRRKRRRKENGAFGYIGLLVLDYLLGLALLCNGWVEPSYETIAKKIDHSVSAVGTALHKLRERGFLTWIRRQDYSTTIGEQAPQRVTISNFYAVLMPNSMAQHVAHLRREAEAPFPALTSPVPAPGADAVVRSAGIKCSELEASLLELAVRMARDDSA